MYLRDIFILASILTILLSCKKDPVVRPTDTEDLNIPNGFPQMVIPDDNPMTIDGVELGRHLFYDPILSIDSTLSCSGCHLIQASFTDNLAFSPGVDNIEGLRSSMSLLNVGFTNTGLFWDGRTNTLEEQALIP